jgi:hypothetical protein
MSHRIAYLKEPVSLVKTPPIKRTDYLAFIRLLPCVVTKTRPVDAAHLNTKIDEYGHTGRGRSQKSSDRWTLPLCRSEHNKQHSMNEEAYWNRQDIDPHKVCLVLWGMWSDYGPDAEEIATRYIMEI